MGRYTIIIIITVTVLCHGFLGQDIVGSVKDTLLLHKRLSLFDISIALSPPTRHNGLTLIRAEIWYLNLRATLVPLLAWIVQAGTLVL